jgi:hypothetical protein
MAAWVDLPVPSPPSKVMNLPRIGLFGSNIYSINDLQVTLPASHKADSDPAVAI